MCQINYCNRIVFQNNCDECLEHLIVLLTVEDASEKIYKITSL